MPVKPVEFLAERLRDIAPTDHTSRADLDLVRRLVANDARRFAVEIGASDADRKALDERIAAAVGELDDTAQTDALIDVSPGARLSVPFAGLAHPLLSADAVERLGPFRTPLGWPLDIGRLTPFPWDEIELEGSDVPAMLVPKGGAKETGSGIAIKFEDGTLWIRADQLVSEPVEGLDSKSFVGIPVNAIEGLIESAGGLTAADPLNGKLSIQLGYPAGESEVCGAMKVVPPTELEIAFDGSGKVFYRMSGGSVAIGDEEINLESGEEITFDTQRGRLIFLAKATPDAIDLGALTHTFAKAQGKLDIKQAGWALPAITATPGGLLPRKPPSAGWAFQLIGDARVDWDGLEGETTQTDPWLECALDNWVLEGSGPSAGADFALEGWPLDGGRQNLGLDLPDIAQAAMGCDPTNGQFVSFTASFSEILASPVDSVGRATFIAQTPVTALISQRTSRDRFIAVRSTSNASSQHAQFVIKNAVFHVDDIALSSIRGTLGNATQMARGQLRLRMEAFAWYPILPDPYVSNLPAGALKQRPSTLLADVEWSGSDVNVDFSGGVELVDAPVRSPDRSIVGTDINTSQLRKDGQTRRGRQLRSKKQEGEWANARRAAQNFQGTGATLEGKGVWEKEASRYRKVGVRMLDVSTNRDQIGVALNIGRQAAGALQLSGMTLVSELSDVRVFALPQIQWEPVRTLDADQDLITLGYFPTPLASADDGGPTQIESRASKLAPVIPDLTVDAMIEGFGDGAAMQMVTTLPFGIHALLTLRPNGDVHQQADRVRRVEPSFDPYDMVGGLQLAFEAGERNAAPPYMDPGFRGVTYQSANGVDLGSGAPLNISVLGSTNGPSGSVEAMFNTEFLLSRPRVPVNRLDISGYGASMFSDWRNPFAAFAEASKVEFQVAVGRTVLEIVKFVSVLYPWGIRVTRSITVERGAGGGVLRRDSGWQATSAGLFDFQYVPEGATSPVPSPYVVHPGLIRGLFEVQRIRPSDRGPIPLTSGAVVLPMYFDTEFEIGTEDSFVRTPSKGVLGFLHLEPAGSPITPEDLDELLETIGPVGGPIDVELPLDQSGLLCRIVRAEAAATQSTSGPVTAGAILGLPKFSNAGSWAVAAFPGPGVIDEPPEPTVIDDGVSIIRRGAAGAPVNGKINVPSPDPDIRFADASDLFSSSPERDYAFLQMCPTHSFAYRRPSVRVGADHIDAGLPSLFADVLARTTGASLFPPEDLAITLPSNTELKIDNGVPRLRNPINMSVTRAPLVLSDSDVGSGTLDYGATSLMLDIGTDTWSVMVPNLEVQSSILGIEKISTIRLDIIGGSGEQDRLDNVKSILGGFFGDIFDAVPGFGPERDAPAQMLQATNLKHKVKFKYTTIIYGKIGSYVELSGKLYSEIGHEEVSVPEEDVPAEVAALDIDLEVGRGFLGSGVGFAFRGEVPTAGPILVVGAGFDIGYVGSLPAEIPGSGGQILAPKVKGVVTVRVEVGVGYGGDLIVFKAAGYVIGIFIVTIEGGDTVGFGLGIRWEFKAQFLWVKIKAYMEAIGMLLLEADKKFLVGQAEVGFNIKPAPFVSIKFSLTVAVKGEI
ncbi:MAG: hypothetical protein AAGH57_08015 [Pseudomonadota bacterium]